MKVKLETLDRRATMRMNGEPVSAIEYDPDPYRLAKEASMRKKPAPIKLNSRTVTEWGAGQGANWGP